MAQEATKQESDPKSGQDPEPSTDPDPGQDPKPPEPQPAPAATGFDQLPEETKAEIRRLRAEAAENRKAAKDAVAKIEEYEEREKTEAQKAADKAEKAEARAKEAEATLMRYQVAGEKSVPPEAVEFLQGSTRDELEASADKLLKLTRDQVAAEFDGGVREPVAPQMTPSEAHNKGILAALGLEREKPNQ